MKKLFLLFLITYLFVNQASAQKAYDYVVYKGTWSNFNVTLNYGLGYEEATELLCAQKKGGSRKKYLFNHEKRTDTMLYFTGKGNQLMFSFPSMESTHPLPESISITVFSNEKQENFVVYQE